MNIRRSFMKLCSVVLCLSIFCSFTSLYAVEGQFNVSLTVGAGDVIAPSIPSNLTATAVSTSQIDLSWTASTDNVGVLAYRIYRDSVFVATSSTVSYSDIGLSAGTTYSYNVSAVDTSFNESSQSLSASATTFSVPVSGGGSYPVISNVQIIPSVTGALVSWNTNQPSQSIVLWGETGDYELGSSLGLIFSTSHYVNIANLNPTTNYQLKIVVTNGYGAQNSLDNLRFVTLGLLQGRENVRNFTATARTDSVDLSWVNPNSEDFSEVRIVRREGYFPANESDGEVIYEGDREGFSDKDVLQGVRYYYAIFAKYFDGELSSGSLASARIVLPGEVSEPYDPFDSLPRATDIHPLIEALSLIDFDFIQNGRKILDIKGNIIPINGEEDLTVSLDYNKVPEILKTILITLSHPNNSTQTFSFLLRINDDKTAYTATIAPLGESGEYGVSISIVDYKNRGLKKIVGNLFATAGVAFHDDENIFFRVLSILRSFWVNLILLSIIFYLVHRISHRRKETVL